MPAYHNIKERRKKNIKIRY